MPTTDPIADLVAGLAHATVAGRRGRAATAREIEGDLREAVAARISAGESAGDAAAAVVAEFGDPRAIAAELSTELLAERGLRYTAGSVVGALVLLAAWFGAMSWLVTVPGFHVPAEHGWMLRVSRSLDLAGPLVIAAAVAGWLTIRRSGSLAAAAAVAALQLGFAVALVAGAVLMASSLVVPAAAAGVLGALVATTVVLGTGLASASVGLLVRWRLVRREPSRARS
ncbi:permease prefix domain 1-containing protein [Agrococcus sp. 1P02AA]|uniref:permease prefix domain 1-containing protein n=1 Tax=Agrococcus sp. 1P02AA TaxID=3132259 RepID=UPI0039A523AC